MKTAVAGLLQQVYGPSVRIENSVTTGGGCINETSILSLSNGESVFMKYNSHPPDGFFQAEAQGLELLADTDGGPRVPKALAVEDAATPRLLLLEHLQETSPGNEFLPDFARALAHLHRVTQNAHGLDRNNYIGKTPQINTWEQGGLEFFRKHRLGYQQRLARESGKMPASLDHRLDKLLDKLDNLLDLSGEKPALLHGDLWSGNYFSGPDQIPCIFDPAVYFGLRETDLAMTELFGRLGQSFYEVYNEVFPLNPGYEERKEIYNLYHTLNHLNLFGGSYLSSVASTVNHFIR